jgi:hypothetical protein
VPRVASFLPGLLLLAYGVAFAARALGAGPLAFDDHPGQLARLMHALDAGPAPWAWHSGWWGGYPELQFYPPGWFYAGSVLSWATVGTLSPAAIYQTLLWITWLAPGLAAFVLLRRLLGSDWLALPGSVLVLTFAGDPGGGAASGVEGGVRIGMVAARLAWALLPVLALSLARWADGPARLPGAATLVLAAIVITHPSHAPAAVAILVGAALVSAAPARAMSGAAAALGIALLLVAFWAVPLAWRLSHTRALAWGALSLHPFATPFGLVLIALVVLALPLSATRMLARGLALGVLAVAIDALVVEPLGIRLLPTDRVADGVWMLVLLTAGVGLGRAATLVCRWMPVPLGPTAALLAIVAASLPTSALTLWPRPADWPSLPAIQRGLRLEALWTALRAAPPGRVLFLRSSVPLVYGDAWYRPHSHVTALTPALAGREILGGTFTHGSPVAALLYRGDTSAAPIARLAEQLDGQRVLGQPLDALDVVRLERVAQRFRVTAIVALEDDAPKLASLTELPGYRRVMLPPFLVFVAGEAAAPPQRDGPGRWQVTVATSNGSRSGDPSSTGDWSSTGVAFYPLWRAEQNGRALPTRQGAYFDLEVKPERPGAVRLVYGPGTVELVGLGLSLATAAGFAWMARRGRANLA